MTQRTDTPIDVVYTWVDDTFPGYAEELARHAGKPADRNPNRTRDNLDLLRYSLRSLLSLSKSISLHQIELKQMIFHSIQANR